MSHLKIAFNIYAHKIFQTYPTDGTEFYSTDSLMELVQSVPQSHLRNQLGKQPKLRIYIKQREHTVSRSSFPKDGHSAT